MNIFFVYDDGTLVTPPLNTILPGITRDSIMTLARAAGRTVLEQPVSIDDWRADAASGRLVEVFACGTAAVVTPIGTVRSVDGEFTDRRRRYRSGDGRAAQVAGRHPARSRRRPVQLGPPDPLTVFKIRAQDPRNCA